MVKTAAPLAPFSAGTEVVRYQASVGGFVMIAVVGKSDTEGMHPRGVAYGHGSDKAGIDPTAEQYSHGYVGP